MQAETNILHFVYICGGNSLFLIEIIFKSAPPFCHSEPVEPRSGAARAWRNLKGGFAQNNTPYYPAQKGGAFLRRPALFFVAAWGRRKCD